MRVEDRFAGVSFGAIAIVLFFVAGISVAYLPMRADEGIWRAFPTMPWLDGWVRWDAAWYAEIAERGYGWANMNQHPTHFFPMYPLMMRAVSVGTGNFFIAGMIVTLLSGLGCAFLFSRWCEKQLPSGSRRTAVLALLAYPFAYYLYGAVYSDALFLCAVLGAFVLLESDHPVLAGLAGAVATATRPLAVPVVLGLCVRLLERRHVFENRRLQLARLKPGDAGVLLAGLGIATFSLFLWRKVGDPLAFVHTLGDWGSMKPGPDVWLKTYVYYSLREPVWTDLQYRMLANLFPCVIAFALIPGTFRRFGWGYGLYAATTLLIAFVAQGDLISGMGRYILAAFPIFATAGDMLAKWPKTVRTPVLVMSGVWMAVMLSLYARWYFVS